MPHQARKRFGQNFLVDPSIIAAIGNLIAPQHNQHIVEIGPGQGALTSQLINRCRKLTALEIDRDLIALLTEQFASHSQDIDLIQNFELIQTDALTFDFAKLVAANNTDPQSQSIRVVGNLPYNISTPLLLRLITFHHLIADMTFMLQKEVVLRICSSPGTKHWGRLSVMLQYYYDAEVLLEVPPYAFKPAPKVDSAIIRLIPKAAEIKLLDRLQFEAIIALSFAQRRKTIRNNLKSIIDDQQLMALNINPDQRPEQLTTNQYVALSNYFTASP